MAVSHSVSFVLVLAAVVLLVGMVSCASPQDSPTTVPASVAGDVATPTQPQVTVPPEPTPVATATSDEVTDEGDMYIGHYGAATALVQERIRLSDVVVKASFVRAGEGMLIFRAIQYLKGTGPDRITVAAETESRNTRWDSQEAVLFLKRLTGGTADFEFTDTTVREYSSGLVHTYSGNLPEGYTVDTRNPVWLPIESAGSSDSSLARSPGTGTPGAVITEYESEGNSETISQSDLRDAIDWVSEVASSGSTSWAAGIVTKSTPQTDGEFTQQQILECVEFSLWQLQDIRDSEERWGGRDPNYMRTDAALSSGTGKGWRIIGYELGQDFAGSLPGNQRYPEYKLTGRDAQLFRTVVWDGDNNSRTGFGMKLINLRPLPAGTYKVNQWTYLGIHKPCGYPLSDEPYRITVTSTAPPGTVHEALFDPATTTAGVGYLAGSATTTGVLEPAGFFFGGRDVNITGLTWHRRPGGAGSLDRVAQISRKPQLHRAGRDCRSVPFPV